MNIKISFTARESYPRKIKQKMSRLKNKILQNLWYTELAYGRINKKLNTTFSKEQIEELLLEVITKTGEHFFEKTGKNYYVANAEYNIRITINSNTFSVITVDRICKNKILYAYPPYFH